MEEKLVERVTEALLVEARENGADSSVDYGDAEQLSRASLKASGLLPLLSAAEAFITEAESMGWGERSETAMPGSYDALVKALREVKG